MAEAQRRPVDEGILAVGIRSGRKDRDARPPAPGQPEQAASKSDIAGRNSPAPTSATGPGMTVSLSNGAAAPAKPVVRICRLRAMTSRQRWTLVATIIGSGAVFLDGTIVNVALKQIGQQLPAPVVGVLEGQTYVVSGYLATLAALLILSGALADHYGRRRVYSIGLAGFAATSALCGLAPSLEWLVVFRLAQGAAGALLVPGSIALITHAFDDVSRGRAFGMWAAVHCRH